jgi:type IV pilus assembly protein PilV
MNSIHRQQGSILLESLIAFLIFAMGILGVIGLQATAINNTLDARYRTDAAFLANQIIAQMWVDPDTTTTPPSIKSTYACSPCTTASYANNNNWITQIQSGFLPGVTDTANQPSIAISGKKVTVTVNWASPQNGAVAHNYVTQTQIQFN